MNESDNNLKILYYQQMGSTWWLDGLNIFFIPILGVIGLLLNYISFEIFRQMKIEFQRFKLKKYLMYP